MDKLDLSLADISKGGRGGTNRRGGRGRGGRGRATSGSSAASAGGEYINPLSRDNDLNLSSAVDDDTRGPVRNQRSRQRSNPYARPSSLSSFVPDSSRSSSSRTSNGTSGSVKSITTGNKVLVTNLDSGVTEEDVEEIFEQAGTIKSVAIKKDSQGRSLGTAEVVFAKRSVAAQTVKDFDSAAVDGRPMYLRLIEGPALSIKRDRADQERFVAKRSEEWQDRGARRQSFGARDGGAKESLFGSKLGELDYSTIDDSEYGSFGGRRGRGGVNSGGRNGNDSGGRGRDRNFVRSRGRGRGRSSGSNGSGRAPTTEQLDQDMDSYFSNPKGTAAMAE